ncbi:hypothetical protein IPF37_04325 [bacterium]|nr:MAG: hypothetical protein IPF37_04325 [bacterium]
MKRFIKNIGLLVLILSSSQVHAAMPQQQCNDLILFVDSKGDERVQTPEEHLESDGGYFSGPLLSLVDSVKEAVAPVICTSAMVQSFCLWKTDQQFKNMNEELKAAFATKNLNLIEKKLDEIGQKIMAQEVAATKKMHPESTDEGDLAQSKEDAIRLGLSDLSNTGWYGYVHKHAPIVLLVPKNYIAQRVGIVLENMDGQREHCITECGFRLDNLDAIDDVAPEKLLATLQAHQTREPFMNLDALESMFVTKQTIKFNHDEKEQAEIENIQHTLASWNIFLNGHGGPGIKKKEVDQTGLWQWSIENKEEEIKNLSNANDETTQQQLEDAKRKLEEYRQYLEDAKKTRTTLSQLESVQNLSDEDIIPETAQVAGLPFNDFVRLIKFFERGIKTSFLYYSTCFAGGSNQIFINEILKKLNVTFIVTAQGVGELYTSAGSPKTTLNFDNAKGAVNFSPKMFTNFFAMLREFFIAPSPLRKSTQNPFAAIVKNVVPAEVEYNNQPFIRIPKVGIFGALDADKKVKILTNAFVKINELENKSIDLSNKDLEAALIYPAHIQVPIKIGTKTTIISATPQYATQPKNVTHIFEEASFGGTLSALISNFLSFNSTRSKITFLIKKLTCLDYENSGLNVGNEKSISLENMMIQIKWEGYMSAIQIMLTHNQQDYQGAFEVQSFESDARKTIAEQCQAFHMSLATPEEMPALADKFLDAHDISDIKEPITLSMIADKIDAQVDKSSATQKPGHLKKILLLHVLKALENTPAAELARQGKAKLKYVNNEYKKLEMAGQLAEEELDSIKKRIGIMKARIKAAQSK